MNSKIFENCPTDHRYNCVNFGTECNSCSAKNKQNSSLQYRPIIRTRYLNYKNHPAYTLLTTKKIVDSNRSKLIKKARSQEQKIIESLDGKLTANSGAIFNDGDGYIQLDRRYYIEHKYRSTNRNNFGPNKSEWLKAQQQQVDIFLTTSEAGTIVTMSLETLKEIINK